MNKKERGRISFSFSDAFWLGYDNIKRRFNRSVLLIATITLGTAFFSTIYLTDAFFKVLIQTEEKILQVENYQYWLVFVSLAVCVVSITNSMLISVYERYREIGTMKCLGALDRHILKLFLVESVIIALIGGTLGYLLGLVFAETPEALQAKIKVLNSMSFDIQAEPNLTLTAPLSGEYSGSSINIAWNSDVPEGTVIIEYTPDNGRCWEFVDNVAASLGNYTWDISKIPNTTINTRTNQ